MVKSLVLHLVWLSVCKV